MNEKILFTWSGGKDSAMALHEILKGAAYEISSLLTTVTEDYERVSIHGVRRALLEEQAASLGLPLEEVFIPKNTSDGEYEARMGEVLEKYRASGVSAAAFGDIFLEDLRRYRENNLSRIGMKAIFPLWKRDSAELARAFIRLGFKAVITCVDSHALDRTFAGRIFNEGFLSEIPPSVDPCGENGEFHSFVYDGPLFRKEISFTRGEVVLRENRFWYCDLIPPAET